jgi:nanoRNase/pAp phosphatase (c-di-AMP/oligoRNAs hydrolase)
MLSKSTKLACRPSKSKWLSLKVPCEGTSGSRGKRGAVDCSQLAEIYGGGGHKAAAGAFLPGPLAAGQPGVLEAVRQARG